MILNIKIIIKRDKRQLIKLIYGFFINFAFIFIFFDKTKYDKEKIV